MTDTAVTEYSETMHALAVAENVEDVKIIRDMANALQTFAKQAKDLDQLYQATEIRMRAERKAGELLIEMAARGERHEGRGGEFRKEMRKATKTLKDLKVSRTQSSRWQKMARMDGEDFEAL